MAYPALFEDIRRVAINALVSVDGNRYSVPPALVGTDVTVRQRLGDTTLVVLSAAGTVVATHHVAQRGQGRVVRLPEHTAALENVALGAFSTDRPCKTKANRPPTEATLRVAAEITGGDSADTGPVIDLSVYQRFVDRQEGA